MKRQCLWYWWLQFFGLLIMIHMSFIYNRLTTFAVNWFMIILLLWCNVVEPHTKQYQHQYNRHWCFTINYAHKWPLIWDTLVSLFFFKTINTDNFVKIIVFDIICSILYIFFLFYNCCFLFCLKIILRFFHIWELLFLLLFYWFFSKIFI